MTEVFLPGALQSEHSEMSLNAEPGSFPCSLAHFAGGFVTFAPQLCYKGLHKKGLNEIIGEEGELAPLGVAEPSTQRREQGRDGLEQPQDTSVLCPAAHRRFPPSLCACFAQLSVPHFLHPAGASMGLSCPSGPCEGLQELTPSFSYSFFTPEP